MSNIMPVPFSVLRRAYQHAHEVWQEHRDDVFTLRDYWPECVRMAIEDWQEEMRDAG